MLQASHVWSVDEAGFFMKKRKSHIAALSCIPLLSHTNVNLESNPMIESDLKKLAVWGFIFVSHF